MNFRASPYGILVLAGIAVSLLLWVRLARRDGRLPLVYLSGLCGAFIGAKLAYIFAEGWLHVGEKDMWVHLLTGKSILGALLGGYAGVEAGKWGVGFTSSTGDLFALVAPVGILIGRIGCLGHGCCLGQACDPGWYALPDAAGAHRWPAVPVEMTFNLFFLVILVLVLRPRQWLTGQHFHLYLAAYGLFRLIHEAVRDTPRVVGFLSGYQLLALGMVFFAGFKFWQRQKERHESRVAPSW